MKMKRINSIKSKALVSLGLILTLASGCERDLSDDAILATYPASPEVFIDGFSGGLEYLPFGGSKLDAFTVDAQTFYSGTASMRFDVPNVGDPDGAFAGAIFPDYGGRNLTGYDALTFWAKATQPGTLNEIGFGSDFGQNRHIVTQTNLRLTTNWKKYIIPIPDPSKLTTENGMFWYAEGPENGNGYSFWIDELKFEKLGTIAQPRPAIFNGADLVERSFLGTGKTITGLTQTFNLGSGQDVTVNAAPAYFTFISSNTEVAVVDELGVITIVGVGKADITATLGGVKAAGSLSLEVFGAFDLAPIPTRDPNNVISIFSDTYQNVPVDFFNGYWEPFQTTESSFFVADGNNMINYTNFNFVGNQFANPTVDASQMTHLHVNMYIPDEIPDDLDFLITVVDFGADGVEGGGDDTREQLFFYAQNFTANAWATLEAPITLANKSNLGLIIYENINNPTTTEINSFYLDNIYFYRN
jgi:hypothetical protein